MHNSMHLDPRKRRQLIIILLLLPLLFLCVVKLHYYMNPLHVNYVYSGNEELIDERVVAHKGQEYTSSPEEVTEVYEVPTDGKPETEPDPKHKHLHFSGPTTTDADYETKVPPYEPGMENNQHARFEIGEEIEAVVSDLEEVSLHPHMDEATTNEEPVDLSDVKAQGHFKTLEYGDYDFDYDFFPLFGE